MTRILDMLSSMLDIPSHPLPTPVMSSSFEEKSTWFQLAGLLVVAAVYLTLAGPLLAAGVTDLPPYGGHFALAVVLQVVLLIATHTVAALLRRPEPADERDRLIAWRSEARTSWVLVLGVLGALNAMVLGVAEVWVAHGLLAVLFLSELARCTLQLVAYRRGF